jgi:hypothetical protein
MGSPDIDLVWKPGKNIIVLADFYLNWAISTPWSLVNSAPEFCGDDMKPEADSQYRKPKIEIHA